MTTITNNKLTDERVSNATLIRLIQWAEQHNSHYVAAALCELQERRKADSAEPAGYHVIKECGKVGCSVATLEEAEKTRDFWNKRWTIRPYFYTQPASEREQIRREHAEWSDATFGDVGPIGPLKHLSKEALEAAAEPDDLSEWADMQFLLWDAQRRAGISDEQITQAMVEKLAVNKQREWPEPKDGEPRLHIKAQPAPVVPEEMPKGLAGQIVSLLAHNIGDKFLAQKIWNACRAALLQGSQPVSNCDELQVIGWLRSDYNSDDKRDPDAPLFMLGSNNPSETWGVKYMPLTGNSPVTPDGWISCSERMPEDEQEVIVQNKLGYRYVSYFDEHSGLFFDMRGGNQINCIEHILVTHWRPMSVPPQH